MLFHLLSILDAIAGLSMIAGHAGLLHFPLLYMGLYLCAKVLFWRDPLSVIDLCAGIYIFFIYFGHASALTWVFGIYFLYKTASWLFFSLGH